MVKLGFALYLLIISQPAAFQVVRTQFPRPVINYTVSFVVNKTMLMTIIRSSIQRKMKVGYGYVCTTRSINLLNLSSYSSHILAFCTMWMSINSISMRQNTKKALIPFTS